MNHPKQPHLPFPPGSQVAAYLRDSGADSQERSVDQQEGVIREWCAENGYTLTRVYADRARSGGSSVGREQLDRMIEHFRDGAEEAGVVFWDYSRWARNFDDGQYFLSTIRRLGYQVHSLGEPIPEGSAGKVVESLHLWAAEQYREQLSKNVKRGQRYVVTVHKSYIAGNPPSGYHIEELEIGVKRSGQPRTARRLVPDPETAPLVKRAFEMRAAGYSIREVHDETGLLGSTSSYTRMFANKIYLGVGAYAGLEVEDFCEPLVDLHTWRAVQAVQRQTRQRYGSGHPRRQRSSYLLSGLARCGVCGAPLAGATITKSEGKKRAFHYYRCVARDPTKRKCRALSIPKEAFEEQVLARLRDYVLTPQVLQELYQQASRVGEGRRTAADARIEQLEAELKEIRTAIERLVGAVKEAGHSQALLGELAAQEVREMDLKEALAAAKAEREPAMPELTPGEVAELARDMSAVLAGSDLRAKQLLLRSFVHEIHAKRGEDGKIEGRISYHPPANIQGELKETGLS